MNNPKNKEEVIACITFISIIASVLLYCVTTNTLTLLLIPTSLIIHTISMHYYEKTLKANK